MAIVLSVSEAWLRQSIGLMPRRRLWPSRGNSHHRPSLVRAESGSLQLVAIPTVSLTTQRDSALPLSVAICSRVPSLKTLALAKPVTEVFWRLSAQRLLYAADSACRSQRLHLLLQPGNGFVFLVEEFQFQASGLCLPLIEAPVFGIVVR